MSGSLRVRRVRYARGKGKKLNRKARKTQLQRKLNKNITVLNLDNTRSPAPCYCGYPRIKHQGRSKWWLCHQCWMIQTVNDCYQCKDSPNCENLIGDKVSRVCVKCAFKNDGSSSNKIEIIGARLDAIG